MLGYLTYLESRFFVLGGSDWYTNRTVSRGVDGHVESGDGVLVSGVSVPTSLGLAVICALKSTPPL